VYAHNYVCICVCAQEPEEEDCSDGEDYIIGRTFDILFCTLPYGVSGGLLWISRAFVIVFGILIFHLFVHRYFFVFTIIIIFLINIIVITISINQFYFAICIHYVFIKANFLYRRCLT
jgi:hypothetical protein